MTGRHGTGFLPGRGVTMAEQVFLAQLQLEDLFL